MKFSALLCPCFLRRCTFLERHNSAPLFYVRDCGTFPDILFVDKHLTCPKFVLGKVWYCNILNETLKTWKANSHLPPHCPPHLGTNGQIFQVPNCPQQELQDQIKFPRISQLEYLRGRQKHTFSEKQSFHNPAGTRLARFESDFLCTLVVSVPPEIWNQIRT